MTYRELRTKCMEDDKTNNRKSDCIPFIRASVWTKLDCLNFYLIRYCIYLIHFSHSSVTIKIQILVFSLSSKYTIDVSPKVH